MASRREARVYILHWFPVEVASRDDPSCSGDLEMCRSELLRECPTSQAVRALLIAPHIQALLEGFHMVPLTRCTGPASEAGPPRLAKSKSSQRVQGQQTPALRTADDEFLRIKLPKLHANMTQPSCSYKAKCTYRATTVLPPDHGNQHDPPWRRALRKASLASSPSAVAKWRAAPRALRNFSSLPERSKAGSQKKPMPKLPKLLKLLLRICGLHSSGAALSRYGRAGSRSFSNPCRVTSDRV